LIDSITTPNAVRAWTITGAYGTGKSSFAHFLSAICSSKQEEIRKNAFKILKSSNINIQKINRAIPEHGFIKAVVTAQKNYFKHSGEA
jgi:ABC-type transport system involved in cytochrome bd biosynthesis fused ATPase/permease subunit